MSDFLQSCLSVEEAHQRLSTLVAPLFPGTGGGVLVLHPLSDRTENIATWGDLPEFTLEFNPPACWALHWGLPEQVAGPTCSGECCGHIASTSTATTLCLPLLAQGEILGLFYLSAAQLPQHTQLLARAVAERLTLALANLHLRETLKQQSIRDSLTGLFNRRYLEESLAQEIRRAQRHDHPIGVIMLDIDHFKGVNDTYGHEAGDRALEAVGQLLLDNVRGSDVACRYGGEEMILILPESPLETTLARAEEIRQALNLLQVSYSGLTLTALSASLGVASFPDHGLRAGDVLKAADVALYQAKDQGRNQVVVATVPAVKVAGGAGAPLSRDIS